MEGVGLRLGRDVISDMGLTSSGRGWAVSGFPRTAFDPGWFCKGGSDHVGKPTRGRGTVAIPPIPRTLTSSRSGAPISPLAVGCRAQDQTVDG